MLPFLFTISLVKPQIQCHQQNGHSVVVRISAPSVFERKEEFHIANIHLKTVRIGRTPALLCDDWPKIKVWDSESGEEEQLTQEITFAGHIPGKQYRVNCEIMYDSEDVLSNEASFTSPEPHCKCN